MRSYKKPAKGHVAIHGIDYQEIVVYGASTKGIKINHQREPG